MRKIILSLPTNKSLGPDGFMGEYYKTFQNILIPHLVKIYSSAAASSSFPPEMLQALIVALPKPGIEPDSPQNFRSISLLNNNIKIYAKLLAIRLVNILPSLIDIDQSGFTKGRQTAGATRHLINVIHMAGERRTPSLLHALDVEKAFNRIYWKFLAMVLNKFGFDGPIHNAIMALYTSSSA